MKLTILLSVLLRIALIFLLADCSNPSKTGNKISVDSTDKFADNIRKTDFQSPENERKSFHLPPGFEITLFAAEPDISKPINIEFDDRGRLWVTNTLEYPMPARKRKGRDHITILEDTDGDGKADKFTPFADTLNIPIGITPVYKGAIAYSIPNIYKFTDSNDDGRADVSTKLVGPFEYEDTHGMVNNLVRGYDGWIHACHGYANNSTVAGSDGDSIHMSSGNTFRFREDGSRVEATTFGRINPFGYAFDEWGYLYSLDCHTKPIYQLIHGAQYPAQGTQEPSIGWAPVMMSYEFGSTANSGLVYYTGTQFPDDYKNNFFSGNVVTSRINRNTMSLHGSSPESKREEDFLISDDPWFRPADLKTGPDGSIYVADFYNRIIGHYEVPKEHPDRDRTSGRIWKITYTGKKSSPKNNRTDWSKATLTEIINALNLPQLTTRMMLANKVVDIYGQKAVEPLQQILYKTTDSKIFIQGLWILYRLNALSELFLQKALQHTDPMVQVHGLRVLSEMKTINAKQRDLAIGAISNKNPQVQRMAVEVAARFPQFSYLQPIIALYNQTGEQDSHLKYTAILSIINHLKNTSIMKQVAAGKWHDSELKVLALVMPEVPSKEAADFSFTYLKTHKLTGKQLQNNLKYISRYSIPAHLDALVATAQQISLNKTEDEYKLYKAVSEGIAQRGGKETAGLKKWSVRVLELGLAPSVPVQQPPESELTTEELNKIITERLASFDSSSVTIAAGQQVFVNNCSACHRIENNAGGSIGPQLSGIGTWGRRALTEKILNPNGNISTAYRTFNVTLKSGKTLSGLYRREEGEVLVFANYNGEEFLIPKAEIKEKVPSKYTLMPANFRTVIAKKDFDALLKYLLSIKENQ